MTLESKELDTAIQKLAKNKNQLNVILLLISLRKSSQAAEALAVDTVVLLIVSWWMQVGREFWEYANLRKAKWVKCYEKTGSYRRMTLFLFGKYTQ